MFCLGQKGVSSRFFEEAEFVLQRLQVGEFDFDDALAFARVGDSVQLLSSSLSISAA